MSKNGEIVGLCIDAALAIVSEKESELGKLDAVAGDGDHGAGMVRGFKAAADVSRDGNAGQVILSAGMAFSNAAGGASGALVGMFIMTIGSGLQGDEIDAKMVHTALKNGLGAIEKLGKAQVGDKTMIDTLAPFIEAFGQAAANDAPIHEAWAKALPAAETGMKATADMISKRGRAAVLKEKSRGSQDPGATSMYYVLQAVGDVLNEQCGSK